MDIEDQLDPKKYQKIWEQEQNDNPHLFKTVMLTKHKSHEEALEREAKFQKALNVIDNPLYANLGIAKRGFGNLSAESRKIISEKAKMRDYSYMKGKNHHYYGGRNDLNQTGGKNPFAKQCIIYGIHFDCIASGAKYFNISYKKCYTMVVKQINNCRKI